MADLRSLQDWYLRYQLETVPGVAEVATIGGFVRQYQVNVDPDKLRAYGIPLSTVIERVRASTNEVGGRLLEMGGAEYMIRGLGYLHSLSDLETVPVATKNGTPVLVRDLGTVTFGPDIREGAVSYTHLDVYKRQGDHFAVGQDHLSGECPCSAGDYGDPIAASELGWVWVIVDAYVGERANHLLNHRGVRFSPFDRLWDPHDVRDDVRVICGVHPFDVAGVEGVVARLHELE